MTSGKRLGSSLRDQLRVFQIFAEQHYWQRRQSSGLILPAVTPVCGDLPPNPPRASRLHCPMCALKFALEEMTVEHAPQRGGQSRLGSAAVAVLTCRRCNNTAGRGFEGDAAVLLNDDQPENLTPGELDELTRQRAEVEQVLGIRLLVTQLPFYLSDVKTAYLIAFATLGYRWALASGLRGIRAALTAGAEPPPHQATVVQIKDGDLSASPGVVLEVARPAPCVIVTAATGYGVVLPMPGSASIPAAHQLDQLIARRYPWPQTATHAKVNEVERAYRLGTLFHADLCHSHQLPTSSM